MDGVHDCGGVRGMGRLVPAEGASLYEAWERRALAMHLSFAMSGLFNLDEMRMMIEKMPARDYLEAAYFERWLFNLENQLIGKGTITATELMTARAQAPAELTPAEGDRPETYFESGSMRRRDVEMASKYKVGERVLLRRLSVPQHTRLPKYAAGLEATIIADRGIFNLPDSVAHGRGDAPQPVYTVRIRTADIWSDAHPNDVQFLDVWESYIITTMPREAA